MMTLEYIAGFFDADGCVCVGKNGWHRKRGQYGLACTFTNCDLATLQVIQDTLGIEGGHIYRLNPATKRRRQSYHLIYRHGAAASVLKKIIGYLYVKQKQAVIALEFQQARYHKRPWTQEVEDFEVSCRQQIRDLNGYSGGHKQREQEVARGI